MRGTDTYSFGVALRSEALDLMLVADKEWRKTVKMLWRA